LSAIGLDAGLIACSVRFGLGKGTTAADVERLIAGIEKTVRRIRGAVTGTASHALRSN
jgi:cysteine sulfinate desulfinase/cysteine desulfurase-like protein